MLFKRSTRSIVLRGRNKETAPGAENTEVAPSDPPGAIENTSQENAVIVIPEWAILAVCGVIVLVIIFGISALFSAVQPASPVLTDDRAIVSVQADAALISQVMPGDIVRVYSAEGKIIPALQYVQVYKAESDAGILLIVDDEQASALVGSEINSTIVLVVHDDTDRAAELVELQTRINNPVISLTMQEAALIPLGEALEPSFQATISPVEADLPEIIWTSSNPSVAVVEDGNILAKSVGEVTISAACGGVEASCKVTVEIPLSGISLETSKLPLGVGESLRLNVNPDPVDATHFDITWSSADSSIATVAADGTITAVAPGTVGITAACGDISATCMVTVGYHTEVAQLDKTSMAVVAGQTGKLSATLYPSTNVIDQSLFESSDPAIVTVAADGTVTGVAPGTATITFRCGGATAFCEVTVTEAP